MLIVTLILFEALDIKDKVGYQVEIYLSKLLTIEIAWAYGFLGTLNIDVTFLA